MTHNNEDCLGFECLRRAANVSNQGQATKFVQYLGPLGFHSSAQASGHY
jgi:hypothetical protein